MPTIDGVYVCHQCLISTDQKQRDADHLYCRLKGKPRCINNKMTYEQIKPYITKGLISEQVHPENPDVRIFNYTNQCQFEKAWDDVTKQCRGLIMNVATGEILARPFPKFFNLGEHQEKGWPIPNEKPVVTEKLDGSLGIMYNLNGKARIATRGSFVSDQAVWATNWFRENYGDLPIREDVTNLFEIIYPENKIVVNYDFSGLVYLGSIDKPSGRWMELPSSIRGPKKYPAEDWEKLASLDEPNSEGFVIFFPEANVRMKIKFPEYVRLHKIVTGLSEIGIWEMLKDGQDIKPLIEKVPDEFFGWVKGVRERLMGEFKGIESEALQHMHDVANEMAGVEQETGAPATRAMWAEQIKKMKHPSLGFAIADGKDYEKMIWKMIRPHGKRVFKVDVDA